MISGPVYPRNRESLWEIVQRHLERIESGLQWIARDVHFDEGCSLEGLACDAGGRPVLFVVHVPDEMDGGDLVRRVVASRVAFRRSRGVLTELLPHDAVDYLRPPRVLVVCREMNAAARECLLTLGVPDLEAFQVRAIRVGGDLRIGITPLLGGARRQRRVDFDVPPGFATLDDEVRGHVAKFMELVRRVDPDARAAGDRYARTVLLGKAVIADVRLSGQRAVVGVPALGAEPGDAEPVTVSLDSEAAVASAVNLALRRCLAVHDELAAERAPTDSIVADSSDPVEVAAAATEAESGSVADAFDRHAGDHVDARLGDSGASKAALRSNSTPVDRVPAAEDRLALSPSDGPEAARPPVSTQSVERPAAELVEPSELEELVGSANEQGAADGSPSASPEPKASADLASVREAIARTARGDQA